jgi:uncharacterized protein
MKKNDLEASIELKKKIESFIHLIDFKVYGSRARGDNDEYSDLDVFIEIETVTKHIKRIIQDSAWEIGLNHSIVITPVISSRQEIEDTIKFSPFLQNVQREGIPV